MSSPRAVCRVAPCVILLVDDEPLVRRMTSRTLMEGGYRVLEAAHGLEALDLLRRGAEVDLILSDVTMPHMDGANLARAVAREFPDLPVVLVSGYSGCPIDVPPRLFLQKPFLPSRLLALVAELIQAP